MSSYTQTRLTPRLSRRRAPGLLARLWQINDTWRQRNKLARLDDASLRDIGLTRDEVAHEVARPIWDVPAFWRN